VEAGGLGEVYAVFPVDLLPQLHDLSAVVDDSREQERSRVERISRAITQKMARAFMI